MTRHTARDGTLLAAQAVYGFATGLFWLCVLLCFIAGYAIPDMCMLCCFLSAELGLAG